MANPATTLARTAQPQDKRIPGLPVLPAGTDANTLTVPVYNSATDQTHQAPIGGPPPTSNAVVGGPKLVQYLDSHYYGVPAGALTLDRLVPATIIPGTLATVDNPSTTPLTTTEPPKQYVATSVAAGTAGAMLVPRYIGAAAGDTVPVAWQEVLVTGGGYTDQQARVAQLNRVPAQPTTTVTLTAESPTDYGPAASGTFTVDATNCVVGKVVCFSIGPGGSAPVFTNSPAAQPFKFVPANIYAAGQAFSYSLLVRVDRIEVVIFAD